MHYLLLHIWIIVMRIPPVRLLHAKLYEWISDTNIGNVGPNSQEYSYIFLADILYQFALGFPLWLAGRCLTLRQRFTPTVCYLIC